MGANIKPLKSYKQYGVPKVNVALHKEIKNEKLQKVSGMGALLLAVSFVLRRS